METRVLAHPDKTDIYSELAVRYGLRFEGFVTDMEIWNTLPEYPEDLCYTTIIGFLKKPIFTDGLNLEERLALRSQMVMDDRGLYERNALRVNNINVVLIAMQGGIMPEHNGSPCVNSKLSAISEGCRLRLIGNPYIKKWPSYEKK